MTKSIKTITVMVKLFLEGNDVGADSVQQVIENMDYNFSYEDEYVRIVDTEILDTVE